MQVENSTQPSVFSLFEGKIRHKIRVGIVSPSQSSLCVIKNHLPQMRSLALTSQEVAGISFAYFLSYYFEAIIIIIDQAGLIKLMTIS
mmetsp:Transcript_24494/g.48712  ORF Transcript_24494/g.48712 Transcript_24494/m.48712 type:complete len:88 (-) Transcript_24494:970-1233(-)